MWAIPFVASAAMDLFGGYGTKAGAAHKDSWVTFVKAWAARNGVPYHEALKNSSANGLRHEYYGGNPPPVKRRSKPSKKYVYHRGHDLRGQPIKNGPLSAAEYWATHGKRGKGKRKQAAVPLQPIAYGHAQLEADEVPDDFIPPPPPQPPKLEGKRRSSIPALEVPPEELQFLPAPAIKFEPGLRPPVNRERGRKAVNRGLPDIDIARRESADLRQQSRAQLLAARRQRAGKGGFLGKLRGSGISLREWNEANG